MGHPQREFSRVDPAPMPTSRLVDAAHGVRRFLAAVHPDAPVQVEFVRAFLRARARRTQYFDGNLFADPAWDMLLELFASELEQRRMTVGSLCVASRVPATTALRWIGALDREGLIEKRCDRLDARRIYVNLSSNGSSAMASYFGKTPFEFR